MIEQDLQATGIRPAGYGALIARFHLEVIPNWHQSFVATGNSRRTDTTAGMTEEVYPARYWPGDTLGDHLEFALKYDGTNLAIQEIVDMPDRKIDLFIQACLQNNGRLSARKRASLCGFLSDEEVTRMEEAIRSAYGGEIGSLKRRQNADQAADDGRQAVLRVGHALQRLQRTVERTVLTFRLQRLAQIQQQGCLAALPRSIVIVIPVDDTGRRLRLTTSR